MNKQALGRIVAGFKRERGFISAATQCARAAIHDVFRAPSRAEIESMACGAVMDVAS
jgi:hypothetical protein